MIRPAIVPLSLLFRVRSYLNCVFQGDLPYLTFSSVSRLDLLESKHNDLGLASDFRFRLET